MTNHPTWSEALRLWRAALRGECELTGLDEWCRPEIVDGLGIEKEHGRPVRLQVFVADGWPLGSIPAHVDLADGRVLLRPVRAPRLRLQCANIETVSKFEFGQPFRGTLAALATDRYDAGVAYGVTAGHVLGGSMRAAFADPVCIEVAAANLRLDRAYLAEWTTPLACGLRRFDIDAGIVRVAPTDVRRLFQACPELLAADTTLIPPKQGDKLSVLLADGSNLSGTAGVPCVETKLLADLENLDGSLTSVEIRIGQLQSCRLDKPSQSGDSGAGLRDSQGNLVGIHCAFFDDAEPGSANAAFTRIADVVARFEIEPITKRSLTDPATPRTRPRPALSSATERPPLLPAAPKPTTPEGREEAVDTLARTLWAEARGEGKEGMEAVACVVMNRVKDPGWWGNTVVSVCRMNQQFSCWNPGTASRRALLAVTTADPSFSQATTIAECVVLDAKNFKPDFQDFTKGARHYHTRDSHPGWSRGKTPCFVLGRHVFFNNI